MHTIRQHEFLVGCDPKRRSLEKAPQIEEHSVEKRELVHLNKKIKDGWLPPAHFAPSQFGKDAILKDENVLSSKKKHFFFIIFPNLSNVRIFLIFSAKKPHDEGGKDILKKNAI